MPVTHTTVATGTNDTTKQISKDAWNQAHTVSVAVSEILASGTPSGATVLYGDGAWAAPVAPVLCRIRRAINQSIPTGAGWADLVWDTSAYQVGGTVWVSGATLTIQKAGYYQVFVEATFDGTGLLTVATASMQTVLNGSTVIGDDEKTVVVNGKAAMWVMAQRYFSIGDTLKTQVKHTDSGSVNVLSQGDHSPDIILTRIAGT